MSSIPDPDYDPNVGYVPKQLADYQRQINEAHAIIVDPVSGQRPFQNVSDDSISQQWTAPVAEADSVVDNAAYWLSRMRDPRYAAGPFLEGNVQLNGIVKQSGSYTVFDEILTGTPGTIIPPGSIIFEASGEHSFATTDQVAISADGTVTTTVRATRKGPYVPEAGSVVVIQTPVPGWIGATNPGVVREPGSDEESDIELRRRQQISTKATSYRQIEAVQAAVRNIDGVIFARSYQNKTLVTDERGIPGKTIAVVAVGGDADEICRAISLRVPLGMQYTGNVVRSYMDRNGVYETVRFTRPEEIEIWVRATIRIITDENIQIFPSLGISMIQDAILDFSKNGALPCEPNGNTGFPPGQDIVYTYLYTPINYVGGAEIISVELSTDGENWAQQNIVINWDQVGIFDKDRIQVVIA